MISVKVLNEWHELDTLNGFYRLEDLFWLTGRPEGLDPRAFLRSGKRYGSNDIQVNKYTWVKQHVVYGYAAYLDPEFKAVLDQILDADDRAALARTVATGVKHR